jgi:Bacterial Ig domain
MANIEMPYGSTTSQSFVLTTSMTGVTVPPNSAPSVVISAPSGGGTFTAPATVTLTATANDVDGTIASVRFYAGPLFIGTATASRRP